MVCDYAVKTVVLGVVVGGSGWEKRMVDNVVPVLLSLPHASTIRLYSTESDTRIGYALADSIGVIDPMVVGNVTQMWLFDLVRKHFLAEFVGLDPLSVLDYLRVRLASVVQESFLDRLPHLRRVSILDYICRVWFFKGHLILFFFCFGRGVCVGGRRIYVLSHVYFYFILWL